MLSGEKAYTTFIIFGLTQLGIELTIYRTIIALTKRKHVLDFFYLIFSKHIYIYTVNNIIQLMTFNDVDTRIY